MASCPAIDTPGSSWPHYCPSLSAAALFAVLFGLVLLSHVGLAIYYRKTYCLVALSNADWFILELVAPVWTNAFAYMVMGRLVYNYISNASVLKIKAWRFGLLFVMLDIIAFFIQLGGLAIVGAAKHPNNATTGIHIYMCGIAFQELCIIFFLGVAVRFHLKLRAQAQSENRRKGLVMLYTVYVVVGLISVRIIFRLIEYSGGLNSSIALHQAYEYIFDSALMFIALALFCVVHPGRIMPGKDTAWPSRKERKAMKKHGETPHGHLGELEDGYASQVSK